MAKSSCGNYRRLVETSKETRWDFRNEFNIIYTHVLASYMRFSFTVHASPVVGTAATQFRPESP